MPRIRGYSFSVVHRSFTYAAVVAWTMLQLPLVFCQSGCGDEAAYAVLMSEHSCHDEASEQHKNCCVCHCGCEGEDSESPSHHDEDEGEHVIVQLPNMPVDGDVDVPPHLPTTSIATTDTGLSLCAAPHARRHGACHRGDPPPLANPVTASDRLLV